MKGLLGKVLHLGGEALQVVAAGGLTLFGVSPKVAVAGWALGKVLSVFGVNLRLPAVPGSPS